MSADGDPLITRDQVTHPSRLDTELAQDLPEAELPGDTAREAASDCAALGLPHLIDPLRVAVALAWSGLPGRPRVTAVCARCRAQVDVTERILQLQAGDEGDDELFGTTTRT